MDDFALEDCTVADYACLEDGPYVDDCVFAPEFMSNDYVRVTQLYCDGVVSRLVIFLFLTLCLLKGFYLFLFYFFKMVIGKSFFCC